MAAVAAAVGLLGAMLGGRVGRRRVGAFDGHRIADVARHRAPGAVVAAVLDPARELLQRSHRGVVGHGGGLRRGVRVDRQHARPAPEDALDDRLLAGVVEAADVEHVDTGAAGPRRRGPALRMVVGHGSNGARPAW